MVMSERDIYTYTHIYIMCVCVCVFSYCVLVFRVAYSTRHVALLCSFMFVVFLVG
jgi:hypothetical protein